MIKENKTSQPEPNSSVFSMEISSWIVRTRRNAAAIPVSHQETVRIGPTVNPTTSK